MTDAHAYSRARPERAMRRNASMLLSSRTCLALVLCALASCLSVVGAAPAIADPPDTPDFGGQAVDDYAELPDGSCVLEDPEFEGVENYVDMLLDAYPDSREGRTHDECDDDSEHDAGLAFDWMISDDGVQPTEDQRAMGDELVAWLLETVDGEENMRLRRLGIYYLIWDGEIWSAKDDGRTWEPYSPDGIIDCTAEDSSVTLCHRDHVHTTFGLPGAEAETSWWNVGETGLVHNGARIAVGAGAEVRFAAVKEAGSMYTRRATGDEWSGFFRHGAADSWASTDIAIGPDGRVLLAGIKKDGTLYTRSATAGQWSDFVRHGTADSWASVEIAAGPTNTFRLAAVKKTGSMYTRQLTEDNWSGFYRHGTADSWTSTDIAIGPDGHVLLAGIKKDGTLYTRSATAGQWSDFVRHGTADSWASVEIAAGPTNTFRLAAVKKTGSMYTRQLTEDNWSGFYRHGTADSWTSTDIAIGPDGHVLLAGIKKDGTLYTRSATAGQWSSFIRHGTADSWSNADIAVDAEDRVRLIATKKSGSLYTRMAESDGDWSTLRRHGQADSWMV